MATTKHNKPHSVRSESERKDKVTSIRMTEEQHQKVQERANSVGMTVSNYLITTGVNGGTALTPALLVEIQNTMNHACAVVEKEAPDEFETIQKEVDSLWQKLI